MGCIDDHDKTVSEIVGEFMDEHLEECDNFKVSCPKCSVKFARDQLDKHDCFAELQKLLAEKRQSTSQLKQ